MHKIWTRIIAIILIAGLISDPMLAANPLEPKAFFGSTPAEQIAFSQQALAAPASQALTPILMKWHIARERVQHLWRQFMSAIESGPTGSPGTSIAPAARWRLIASGLLAVVILVQWFSPFTRMHGQPLMDFNYFYAGSRLLFFHHVNPQIFSSQTESIIRQIFAPWHFDIKSLLVSYRYNTGYWNSPLDLILFVPFAVFTPSTGYSLYLFVGKILILSSAYMITWRLTPGSGLKRKIPSLAFATLLVSIFEPVGGSLNIGQIECLYLFPLMTALFLLSSKPLNSVRERIGVFLMVLSGWIKVFPTLFLAVLASSEIHRLVSLMKRSRELGWRRTFQRISLSRSSIAVFSGLVLLGVTMLIVGADSAELWIKKWPLIGAQARIGAPTSLTHFVDAIFMTLDRSSAEIAKSIVGALIRIAIFVPGLKVLKTTQNSAELVFLRASLIACLLPTLMPHWQAYYNLVFLTPILSGFFLARKLARHRAVFLQGLLLMGFVFVQAMHRIGPADNQFDSPFAQALYRPLLPLLTLRLPSYLGAFGPNFVGDVRLPDILAYPGTLLIYFVLIAIAKGINGSGDVTMSNRASPGEGTPGLGTREPGSDPTVTPLQGANEPADSTSIVSSGIPIVNIVKEWIFRSGLKTLSVASTLLNRLQNIRILKSAA